MTHAKTLPGALFVAVLAASPAMAGPPQASGAAVAHPNILPPSPCSPVNQTGTQSHGGGGGAGKIIVQGGRAGDQKGIIVQGGKTAGGDGIIVQGGRTADAKGIIVQGGRTACTPASKAKKKP